MPQSDTRLSPRDISARSGQLPQVIGFLLLPEFALMSYASAIEPLRAANALAGRALYAWRHISIDGAPVRASNGVEIKADQRIGDDVALDTVFVCAAGNPTTFEHKPTLRWLRRLARGRVRIGGVSGGPYVLARAGVLSGHRCTIHWEHMPAFTEEFPDLAVTRSLYVIDRDRLTSSGGISALDMMHALIEQDHGHDLAAAVSEWFLHTEVRLGSGPQRMSARERFDVSNSRLLRALEYMDAHMEAPVPRSRLSAVAGVSVRQLERLFAAHLRVTINAHYLRIRLDRARILLRQTGQPVLAIAVATGFTTASHFSRAYRRAFGFSPKDERARGTAGTGGPARPPGRPAPILD